ncbi:DNA/RNA non-specific endonuclease [Hydrogenimonas thermophila]|uniref:Endonuclease n=1 Tax=Hydrogenimonas thermophila TaxID=223786 RepID=A0A1I5T4F8_9BACT|nr:DNA/RNA non-specific endonuclease [Hydrogenimonas thermophila]SFP77838.1 endonuclease G [Hydrogenimonas thermophila]
MLRKIVIYALLSINLIYARIPAGLYNNGQSDNTLIKKHIPFGIDMSKAKLQCDQTLVNIAYVSCFNYKTNTPLWSSYTITAKDVAGHSKRYRNFLYDKRVPKRHRVKPSDYTKSGYDRGHLCPNAVADGQNLKKQAQTFLMTNIAPQHPKLNREGWNYLEKAVRKWIKKRGKLNVITGVWFDDNQKQIGRRKQPKISIPAYWYKIIYDPNKNESIAFWMPNSPVGRREWIRYKTTIDEIEKKTGIDFYARLQRIKQIKMERTNGKF